MFDVNWACFPKEKHPNSLKRANFMNFWFRPLFVFLFAGATPDPWPRGSTGVQRYGCIPRSAANNLGEIPKKNGRSKSLVLKSFWVEITFWDSSLQSPSHFGIRLCFLRPPLPLPQDPITDCGFSDRYLVALSSSTKTLQPIAEQSFPTSIQALAVH